MPNCETLRTGHNEAYSAKCRENHFWLASVCDVERVGLCQHPSRVDGKGSYVSDVRAGSDPDVISLGHALGEHHLAVIAVCLKPSLSRWALETGHIKQNLVVSSGLQAHDCSVMGDFSVEYFGLSRPPRLGCFLAPIDAIPARHWNSPAIQRGIPPTYPPGRHGKQQENQTRSSAHTSSLSGRPGMDRKPAHRMPGHKETL